MICVCHISIKVYLLTFYLLTVSESSISIMVRIMCTVLLLHCILKFYFAEYFTIHWSRRVNSEVFLLLDFHTAI